MSNSLSITGLARHFPSSDAPALQHVDLEVPAGGCVALLGPSGSGKSTVLRLVAGLDTPDGGVLAVGGRSLDGVPPEHRGTVLVFQRPRLFPHLSVLDNVAFPLTVGGRPRRRAREDARRFLDLVGLADLARRRPSSLSGGQEQRVTLARALAAEPEVLLLDEPFSALDPERRGEMHDLLAELRAAVEPTILLVTHDRHEAAAVADSVALLLDGRIVQHDTVDRLYQHPGSMSIHRFLGGRNALAGTVQAGVHLSGLGALALPPEADVPDGAAHLVIRQEAIALVDATDPAADVRGTVRRRFPSGARTLLEVVVGEETVVVEVAPGEQRPRGVEVGLRLPLGQRHVLPEQASSGSRDARPTVRSSRRGMVPPPLRS